MKGMGNMMKQAQQLQTQMLKLQEEMAAKTVEEVVDPEDVEMLQDLILSAANEALTKSQEMVAAEMSKLTGGLNIPGIT
jgi:DNA-binding protein YbaB